MPLFYRRLLFWTFFLFFLITTPIVVLLSQGYRFDRYKKIFVHSGSVTIKSTPSSVNIYLNGKLQPSSTLDIINNSITVNGLRPGNYNLKVSADGYKDWKKNIEVHSGISTEFWNVYLVPRNISFVELAAEGAERCFPSASGKYIAYFKKNEENLEVWTLDVKNNMPNLIFSQSNLEFPNDQLENIEWNPKEKLLIVPLINNGQKDFLILDSEKKEDPLFLSKTINFSEINRARWSPDNQNEIYFTAKPSSESQENLYRMNLITKEPELILEGIKAYDLSNNSIYFLRQNNIVYKTNLNGKNEKQLILTSVDLSDRDGKIRLIAYDDDRQAIISQTGKLFVYNNGETKETLKKIAENAKSVQFSDDGKKLLYWSDNEINVIFLRKWDVQPRREENEIQQVVRFSSSLKNVFWYRDYEHVLFSTQNSMKIIELDPRDHRIVEDLFKYNSENFSSSYDSANGIFYFIDEVKGKRKLFYFYLPEQTGFFGR